MAKILIVDDDRATTGLLKTVFQMERFKVVACPDPKRVMEVMRKEKPDLVFLDFHLAETVSLPVLREIKTDGRDSHCHPGLRSQHWNIRNPVERHMLAKKSTVRVPAS